MITVSSQLEKGTTFNIFLPAEETLVEKEDVLPEEKQKKFPQKGKKSGKILILEDEEIVINVVTRLLSHLGYESEYGTSGEEVLEKDRKSLKNLMI